MTATAKKTELKLYRAECRKCKGSGENPKNKGQDCNKCGGEGHVQIHAECGGKYPCRCGSR
jgi:DnaJ-class molecular chaperone